MKPVEPKILTANTIEVIKLLSQGYTYKEIAVLCKKTRASVDKQLILARQKLQAKSNTHLVFLAIQKGYLSTM